MLEIILVTSRPAALQAFADALTSARGVHLKKVQSGVETLLEVGAAAPQLVVIDSELPDTAPLGLVQRLLLVNAMINTAVITPLSEAEFHQQSEGLGILTNLPEVPGPHHAGDLLLKLRQVLGPESKEPPGRLD
jgi:DNA-binding response OmpR family regulator